MKLNKLKTSSKYFLYMVLVALFFTSCEKSDCMIVHTITTDKTGKYNYFVETNQVDFRTDQNLKVGDTLYISKKYCH